jgi:hypothetical protein
MIAVKDPSHIARGRAGALKRWNGPRIARIDSLTIPQRDLVLALIQTMKTGSEISSPEPVSEVRDASATSQ